MHILQHAHVVYNMYIFGDEYLSHKIRMRTLSMTSLHLEFCLSTIYMQCSV